MYFIDEKINSQMIFMANQKLNIEEAQGLKLESTFLTLMPQISPLYTI